MGSRLDWTACSKQMTYNQRLHESRRILSTSTCSFLILDPLLLSVFAEGFLLFRSVAMDKVLRRTTGSMKSVSGCPFANIYPEMEVYLGQRLSVHARLLCPTDISTRLSTVSWDMRSDILLITVTQEAMFVGYMRTMERRGICYQVWNVLYVDLLIITFKTCSSLLKRSPLFT